MSHRVHVDGLLELVNSLAFVYFASEATLRGRVTAARARRPLFVVGILNVLLSSFTFHAFDSVSSTSSTPIHHFHVNVNHLLSWVVHVPSTFLSFLGADFLLIALLVVCVGLVVFGFFVVRGVEPKPSHVVYLLGVGALAFAILKLSEAETEEWVMSPSKILVVMTGFAVLCYFDSKRFKPDLSPKEFLIKVARSVVVVLPMFPFLAVVFATIFFFIVSIVEKVLGMDPAFMNGPIYYGTLYGPFAVVYFEVKKWCVHNQSTFLPSSM